MYYEKVIEPCDKGYSRHGRYSGSSSVHGLRIEMMLSAADLFYRIHNAYIISLKKINSSQKSQVFIGSQAIPLETNLPLSFSEIQACLIIVFLLHTFCHPPTQ
jgi:hypothetical protein